MLGACDSIILPIIQIQMVFLMMPPVLDVGSQMRWSSSFEGGKLGAGHAMDFMGSAGGSLREAGVPPP